MGKQAKKKNKTTAQEASQRRHNPKTRGINTKKQGALWAVRRFKQDGKEHTYEVRVPSTQWNPFDKSRYVEGAHEPFDALQLDWRDELTHYALEHDAKLGCVLDINGLDYIHRVYLGDDVENPDEVLIEVKSAKRLPNENRGPRRRSRRKKA